ncbi:MAG: c-type cytochrome [Caldilineaceae bacterium]
MVSRIFTWGAGFLIVAVFSIATFLPDVLRGYIDVSVAQASVSSGQRVYNVYCVGCHGVNGDGNGTAAEMLVIKPRNFVNGNFKFFHNGEPGPLPTDASLTTTIRNGLPGSAMPAFPLLSEQEVADVRSYIKSFREGGWTETAATGVGEVASAPPIDGTTGEELFVNSGCNACHQLDALKSIGGVGPNLTQVGGRRTVDEIKQSIMEPNAVIAENCPAGPCPSNVMPQNFSQRLKAEQIDALAQFLSQQK